MLNKNILQTASLLSKLNNDFSLEKCRIIDEKVYNSKFLFYHFFYWSSDFYDNPYRNILVDYFNKSEISYPGSSYMLSVKLCNKIYGINNTNKKIKTDKNYDQIFKYLESLSSKEAIALFKSIIEFSGADATITCEKSNNKEIEVQKICKPQFDFYLDNSFKDIYFSNVKSTTKDFTVSVLDCYVERESEIFSLIEHAKQNKVPVVLICRGISESAKRNLKSILLRNNILVYPYIEKYNNEDPFKLKDFAQSIGAKIISAEAGDSINSSLVEKSTFTRLTISKNNVKLFKKNSDLVNSINTQISENINNHELIKYLRKRKTRCSPNNTLVRIPKNNITLLNEVKNLIKCYNFCALKGVYTNEHDRLQSIQCEKITDILSEKLYQNINKISYKIKHGENHASI